MPSRIEKFISEFTPEIAASIRTCRKKMYRFVPRGYELVVNNYNALGFGFSPTEKNSQVVMSIVAYPRWVTLFFLKGAGLPDPDSLLQGKGSQVRSIRLCSPADLDAPSTVRLIHEALKPHTEAFASAPRRTTLIKSVAARRRPRRPSDNPSVPAKTKNTSRAHVKKG